MQQKRSRETCPAFAVDGHTRSGNGNTADWEAKNISGDNYERKEDITSGALGCFVKDELENISRNDLSLQ